MNNQLVCSNCGHKHMIRTETVVYGDNENPVQSIDVKVYGNEVLINRETVYTQETKDWWNI